jgi:hypothetical protein
MTTTTQSAHPNGRNLKLRLLAVPLTLAVLALTAGPAMAGQLNGVFHIGSGSWIRMGLPTGGFFNNPYSKDSNKSYTLIASSANGGVRTGVAQKAPSPAFDSKGDSLASSIFTPTSFTGISFGAITTVPPTATVSGTHLTLKIRNLYAEWNKQSFKQGAIAQGTYNSRTHHYQLDWHTTVKGGAFANYTGYWQLEGTFTAN